MTLFLTNWSSGRLHGPGMKLTIMAKPRAWEKGVGRVSALLPSVFDLEDVKAGRMTIEHYRRRYVAKVELETNPLQNHLAPGHLLWWGGSPETSSLVRDGDTLCCACSVDAAARGECHRVWAARFLFEAGWDVVLDGDPYRAPLGGLFARPWMRIGA